jgi:filamentous hemagglutinin family protein
MKNSVIRSYFFWLINGFIVFFSLPIIAQIKPDQSLGVGESSQVVTRPTGTEIKGGAMRNNLLFHSFSDFNINVNQRVNFYNPPGIDHILTRVTGDSLSNINGILSVNGLANLYLINPHGFIFGQDAKLDIKGSLIVSTSSTVNIGNIFNYSTINPQVPPLLVVNVPVGIQLGNDATNEIINRAQLNVGKNLTLQAGEITNTADIINNNGDILIASKKLTSKDFASIGAIATSTDNGGNIIINADEIDLHNNSVLFSTTTSGKNAGDITINTKKLTLDKLASISTEIYESNSTGNGGNITINAEEIVNLNKETGIFSKIQGQGNGGNININTQTLLAHDNSGIDTSTIGLIPQPGKAGNLHIKATKSIELIGIADSSFTPDSQSGKLISEQIKNQGITRFSTATFNSANGGNLTIETDKLIVRNGAAIAASTKDGSTGNGGYLDIKAQTIDLIGLAGLVTSSLGDGQAGNLTINTDKITLDFGGVLSTDTFGKGDAGTLQIQANQLIIGNGSHIEAGTFSTGNSGLLNIKANQIKLFGISLDNQAFSGIFTNSSGSGNAGRLQIETNELKITDYARIAASSFAEGSAGIINIISQDLGITNGAKIEAVTTNQGHGGNIIINTDNFNANNGARIETSTLGKGNAGNVELIANQSVNLDGDKSGIFAANILDSTGNSGNINIVTPLLNVTKGATISVEGLGTGLGGELTINLHKLFLNNGFLSAGTNTTDGGNIYLNVNEFLFMNNNSMISAKANGRGNGGNLQIISPYILAVSNNNNDIIANALEGNGGNINITANGIFGIEYRDILTYKSDINASSRFGQNGIVEINTPGIDPAKGLSYLPTKIINTDNLTNQSCSRNINNKLSQGKFIITGKGGFPESPIDNLFTAILTNNFMDFLPKNHIKLSKFYPEFSLKYAHIKEAQGMIINDKKQIVLTTNSGLFTHNQSWFKSLKCPGD